MKKREIVFADAVGKSVESIKYEENADWQALEVAFSDGTLFSFVFSAQVTVKAQLLEVRSGNLETIRNFGRVSGNPG